MKFKLDDILTASSQTSTETSSMFRTFAQYDASLDFPTKEFRLRPSEFPVCSLTALNTMLAHEAGVLDSKTWSSDMFRNIGTAVHETMHEWVQRSGATALGHAECPACGERSEWKAIGPDTVCEKCGHPDLKYGETEVTLEASRRKLDIHIKGHIDCVLVGADGLYMLDYKTTTVNGQKKARFKQHNAQYALQLLAYAYMFDEVLGDTAEELTGKRLARASLLFITRNNPRSYREFTWRAADAIKLGKGVAETMLDSYGAALAGRDDPKIAVNGRLCKSKAHYEQEVKPFFFDGCPLADQCVNKGKKSKREVLKWLKAEYKEQLCK